MKKYIELYHGLHEGYVEYIRALPREEEENALSELNWVRQQRGYHWLNYHKEAYAKFVATPGRVFVLNGSALTPRWKRWFIQLRTRSMCPQMLLTSTRLEHHQYQ